MAFDTNDDTMSRSETYDLISSEKVDGTAVFNRNGDKLGTVHHFMVGKRDGRVRYAVMSFGGLFGMGERYHPLPWDVLTYDTEKGGYAVDLDKDKLEGAPSYERGSEPTYDRIYGEQVYGYYGVPY
ncbi:PRC-barrel domain-containing protein [Allosphingosinicella sp.]|uniref:PRC-barrel domain-containing protein n=1 Tax=Allosphingosinicella sp. TaxID=2823234 RepID=UPI002FC208DC